MPKQMPRAPLALEKAGGLPQENCAKACVGRRVAASFAEHGVTEGTHPVQSN